VDGLPIYEKSALPSRWYEHSVFNHGSHRTVACTDCHDKNGQGVSVANSRSARDILLPTLQKCQECHTGSGGARNTCVECHRYHSRGSLPLLGKTVGQTLLSAVLSQGGMADKSVCPTDRAEIHSR
jgi:hypothetical protein